MGREPSPMVSTAGLASAAVGEAYIDAVVPPGLAEADHARASEGATAFFNILLRHVPGDPEPIPPPAAIPLSPAGQRCPGPGLARTGGWPPGTGGKRRQHLADGLLRQQRAGRPGRDHARRRAGEAVPR